MLPFTKANPFRPGDWRWQRARQLRDAGKYAREAFDDNETKLIKKYQVAKANCKDETARLKLAERFPGLYWAEQVLNLSAENNVRWAVEARLLANEPIENIADKTLATVDTILWYEKAFFNVLPYLRNQDYIINTIMGKSVHEGLHERQYDLLWKMLGYKGGSHLLDAIICPTGVPTHITGPDQVKTALGDLVAGNLFRKSVVATLTMPVAYNQRNIIELFVKMMEVEKTAGSNVNTQGLIVQNISATLTSIPFTTDREDLMVPGSEYYDKQSGELRSAEYVDLALGHDTEARRAAVSVPLLPAPEQGKDSHGH